MLFYEDLRRAPGGPVGLKGLSTVGKKHGRPKPFPGLQIPKQCAKCILIPWVGTEWKTVVCIDFSLGWRDVYGARHGWRTEWLGQENNVGKGQQEHRFQIANIILSALESSVILCRGLHRLEHSGSVLWNSCPSNFWLFFNTSIFQKLKWNLTDLPYIPFCQPSSWFTAWFVWFGGLLPEDIYFTALLRKKTRSNNSRNICLKCIRVWGIIWNLDTSVSV